MSLNPFATVPPTLLEPAPPREVTPGWEMLDPEDYPNYDDMIIEDGKPVDSIFAEKQERLLTETLYSSWPGPGEGRTFLVLSNVGLFFGQKMPPLVPDVMLSLDVPASRDLSQKENNSYIIWVMGKPPDVVIEFVSDKRGEESGRKHREYARLGITYYVIFDPRNVLKQGTLQTFSLRDGAYQTIDPSLLPAIGLGLRLVDEEYEGRTAQWLRWCDAAGNLIPTGRERAGKAEDRADKAEDRVTRLLAQMRALGIEPEE